jgi:hypothetical protein
MIKTILLDIDGVCNTFQHHVFNCLGLLYPDDSRYPVECGWDIVAAANRLAGYPRFTATSFWNSITREMWASVPRSPDFSQILTWASDGVGKEHVHFLSSPTLNPDSLAGKLEWIQRFAPSWMQRQFLIGPSKHLCANPETLLIDDSDKNVDLFRMCGGLAVLMPRPWNSLHHVPALDHLATAFYALFGD